MTTIIHVDRFGLALLLCVFAACLGPFNTAGEATNFMGSQDNWVVEHSSIVQDGNGFDAILTLRGPGNGPICSAVINGAPPVCAQTPVVVENGVIRQTR